MLQPSAKFSILEDQAEFQPLGLLTQLPKGQSLRDFLRRRAGQIDYVVVEDAGVIQDVDTSEEYERGAPR